jgi:hypothetical protein
METGMTIVLAAGVIVFAVMAIATVLGLAVASLTGLVGEVESLLDVIATRARHAALPHRRTAI